MKQYYYKDLVVNYREDSADESVLSHSFQKDIFLSSIPYFRITPQTIAIDVGAHIGTFSLFIAIHALKGNVYAFEPSHESYKILEENIKDNNLQKRVIAYEAALFDTDLHTRLYHDTASGNWGHSIVSQLSSSFEDVQTITIDTFFRNQKLKSCDLIKFNCEGAEFRIISNMTDENINKIKNWIILYHKDLEEKGDPHTIIKRLKRLGFIVNHLRINEDGKRGWITATKNYKAYYLYSIKSKLKLLFKNKK